jgi:type I restriction-modification system DNA methylase subunit
MNTGVNYNLFYDILLELREEFHRSGRLDDSNAKLDEIIKLLILNYYEAKNSNKFDLKYIKSIAKDKFENENEVAKALVHRFNEISSDKMFINSDGTNIFGTNKSLSLQASDNIFAEKLVSEIGKIDFVSLIKEGNSSDFDIVNECFGHFVRDNFRNNKEDAQYMTPQEVVKPVLDMIFSDIVNDSDFKNKILDNKEFLVMDPTCGVGTLIIEALKHLTDYVDSLDIDSEHKEAIKNKLKKQSILGQDKVDRMVRLSKINYMLIDANISNIFNGNSILGKSKINEFYNKIDLIITNPPFGAKYKVSDFIGNKNYPILNEIYDSNSNNNIDSELVLLDKCISLLKNNGRLFMVVPDSVVSAKGIYAKFREKIEQYCDIKAVIELPKITFAQAGTNTKTCILYLQKTNNKSNKVYMAICDDVGYTVKKKLGVPVKIKKGTNQMLDIANGYINSDKKIMNKKFVIVKKKPSCAFVSKGFINNKIYNPSFYGSDRLKTLKELESLDNDMFELKKLSEIATFSTKKRKKYHVAEDIKHISVLHINPDGTINFREVTKYNPSSKGNECQAGDVIFSKINPRIFRAAAVPNKDFKLVCSTEFEILVPKDDISPYLLFKLLNLSLVRHQIESLTSGTSSSHNRIKTDQLMNVLIPVPKDDTEAYDRLSEVANKVKESINQKYSAENNMITQESILEGLFN